LVAVVKGWRGVVEVKMEMAIAAVTAPIGLMKKPSKEGFQEPFFLLDVWIGRLQQLRHLG